MDKATLQMREYRAELSAAFHDVRGDRAPGDICAREDDRASGRLAAVLLAAGSNGIVYASVRRAAETGLAYFPPSLVSAIAIAAYYEYRWRPGRPPDVRRLG